jgi:hypothetical protein
MSTKQNRFTRKVIIKLYLSFLTLMALYYSDMRGQAPIPKYYRGKTLTSGNVSESQLSAKGFTFEIDSLKNETQQKEIKKKMKDLDSRIKKDAASGGPLDTIPVAEMEKLYQGYENELISVEYQLDSLSKDRRFYDIDLNRNAIFPTFFYNFRPYSPSIWNNYYYHNTSLSTLRSLDASYNKGITNITTELASDFLSTLRLSLLANANVGADTSKEAKKSSDYQKLFNNGGQIAFNLRAPIVFFKRASQSNSENAHCIISFNQRLSTDVFANGQVASTYKFIGQTGGDIYFDLLTDSKKIGFTASIPFAYVYGNDYFYSQYGITDYFSVQCSVGITINNAFMLKIIGPVYSTNKLIMVQPFRVSLQLSPF